VAPTEETFEGETLLRRLKVSVVLAVTGAVSAALAGIRARVSTSEGTRSACTMPAVGGPSVDGWIVGGFRSAWTGPRF
jgi:hypothetical protein